MTQAILSPFPSPGYRRSPIDEGFIATIIDGGPALLGVVLACTQLAVITWGIYGDIVAAFLLAESTRFVILAAMAMVIIATVSYMFGRLAEADDTAIGEARTRRAADDGTPSDAGDLSWPAESKHSESGSAASNQMATSTALGRYGNQGPALRTRFFSEVANELRTPITSICLAARIIRKHHSSTPEVVERFGDTLVNEATRLGELVNEFLELVRLESGRVSWRDEDVPVLELMQTAESYLSELAQLQQRRIAVQVDGGLPPLNCDRERIVQVLTVLLSTAFSNAAESCVIGLYAFEHDGYTIFSITPEGGDSLSFRRAGAPTVSVSNRDSENAVAFAIPTLTFNICQEIVAHHGGHISTEQRSDDTCVFRVALPQSRSRAGSNPEPLDYAAVEAAEALTPARPMVLADEDAAEAPGERLGLETLSIEQAEELLSLPADYTDEGEPLAVDTSSKAPEVERKDIVAAGSLPAVASTASPEQDADNPVLITPPPLTIAASAGVPQLPASQSVPHRESTHLPAVHASTSVPGVTRSAGSPVAVDSPATAITTTPDASCRRGAMIDPPMAGVRPEEDWHAGASNAPTHRSAAPWLAERLRQAAGSSLTRERKPHHVDEDPAPQSPRSKEPRPQATPISRLHGNGQLPPVASTRAHRAPSSALIHRRKLGG